jgi:hypothetical protein
VDWDEPLYYEAAVDIVASLMAGCSAAQWRAEHGGPVDFVTADHMRSLRRAYLAELDPADHPAVAHAIREYGIRLAELGATPQVVPQADPEAFRLDRAAHREIFDNMIAPELFAGIEAADGRPTAVIVAGQPGSGKTTVIRRLSVRAPGAAAIDPEFLSAYHPRSWELVLADDPAAAAVVMWDALGWAALHLHPPDHRRLPRNHRRDLRHRRPCPPHRTVTAQGTELTERRDKPAWRRR